MPGFQYYNAELLQPISPEQPSGADLRYDKLFDEIAEARSADEEASEGVWQKASGRKVSEWDRVAQLCISGLTNRTKDLRLACYLTEAALRLDGFAGLRDCLRLTAELIDRFWDQGLYPAIEDGDLDYRGSALVWLNDRMPDVMGMVPLTAQSGENYGYARYQQALRVGTEAAIASVSGEKRESIQALIRQGWITIDTFQAALRGTKRVPLEKIYQPFDEAHKTLISLEKISQMRFGDAAPSFSNVKERFVGIDELLAPEMRRKQQEEDAVRPSEGAGSPKIAGGPRIGAAFTEWAGELPSGNGTGWVEAEALIRAGRIDQGLAQMATLAARETSGRGQFLRKLALCDVCIGNGRDRLARTILEELNRQVDQFKLDQWESSGLVGAVWSRLYTLCRKSEETDDQGKAKMLYDKLCQLDPWQAYVSCED